MVCVDYECGAHLGTVGHPVLRGVQEFSRVEHAIQHEAVANFKERRAGVEDVEKCLVRPVSDVLVVAADLANLHVVPQVVDPQAAGHIVRVEVHCHKADAPPPGQFEVVGNGDSGAL